MASFVEDPRMQQRLGRGRCRQPPPERLLPYAVGYMGNKMPVNPGNRAVPVEASSDSGNSTGACVASSQEEINNCHQYAGRQPQIRNYNYNNNYHNNSIMPPLNILSEVVGPRPDTHYSNKIFVGGLPDDVYRGSHSSQAFKHFFLQFGKVQIEWPPKFQNKLRPRTRYLHVIYENDVPIKTLLSMCIRDGGGRFFLRFNIPYPPINVRPFIIGDDVYTTSPDGSIADRHEYTVTVRNVPRHYTAHNLAYFAQQHFGPVLSAKINVDHCNYPCGSAIITFGNHIAYVRAVYMKYFEVLDFFRTWDVTVEPYIFFDRQCEACGKQKGTHFCKNVSCLTYWCKACFEKTHPGPHIGNDQHEVIFAEGNKNMNNAADEPEADPEFPPLSPEN